MRLSVKRVYEQPAKSDGMRVLVDRLWPRGLTKERAAVDHWAKDVAPSTELRRWFHSDDGRWPEFKRRYKAELVANSDAVETLARTIGRKRATLMFGTREVDHNHAELLKAFLLSLK